MESEAQGCDLKLLAKPSKVMTALEAIRLHLQHSTPKAMRDSVMKKLNEVHNLDPQSSAAFEPEGS